MAKGVRTDRNLLHEYLWSIRDRNDIVKINQQYLSDELAISNFTLSHILRRMVADGQLERIGNSRFFVKDPATWRFDTTNCDTLF